MKEKQQKAFEALKQNLGLKNVMQTPKLVKVVVSTGVGSQKDTKKKNELIPDRLSKITGQKAAPRAAKKSIASFKSRQGDIIGYQTTLRGERMYGFLDKLVHVALPRTRDFRGVPKTAIDDVGNLTIGIKEHVIFPETGDEDIKDVFGMAVTIVSTAQDKAQAEAFYTYLGIPFSKIAPVRESRRKRSK